MTDTSEALAAEAATARARPAADWAGGAPTGLLVLADGTVIAGNGAGATGIAVGEVCFNTAMTGYQEILTDPSYAGQLIAITGVDTRALTTLIREKGMPNAVIAHAPDGKFDLAALKREAAQWPGMVGLDLAKGVTCGQSYAWEG